MQKYNNNNRLIDWFAVSIKTVMPKKKKKKKERKELPLPLQILVGQFKH